MPEEKLLALQSPVWLELTLAATDQYETEHQQWVDQQAESAAELARYIHTIETQATQLDEMQGVELQRVRSSQALADIRQNDSVAELTRFRTRLEESERAASQQTAGITKLLDQQAEHHNKELARRDDQLAALQERLLALATRNNNPC